MKKEILEENMRPFGHEPVRLKSMGNVLELMYADKINRTINIQKLSDDLYLDLRTGEVKECQHMESRADNKNSVRISLGKLRDIINTNVSDASKCLWVTLTYRENMRDTKRLYVDVKNFVKRLRYAYGKFEYIIVVEPQGRGAWHCHCILIFEGKAPFIPNAEMAKIWGFGFTKTKALHEMSCDNLGAYLTAYLGDMELTEFHEAGFDLVKASTAAKLVDSVDENGQTVQKCVIKGARLALYPPKVNIFRCSRGIKKPKIAYMSEKEAEKKVSGATLTFERTILLSDPETDFSKVINYRQFNTARAKMQG